MVKTDNTVVYSSRATKWVRLKNTNVYGKKVTKGDTELDDWEEIDPIVEEPITDE